MRLHSTHRSPRRLSLHLGRRAAVIGALCAAVAIAGASYGGLALASNAASTPRAVNGPYSVCTNANAEAFIYNNNPTCAGHNFKLNGFFVAGPQGPAGPAGPTGPAGPAGPAGPSGVTAVDTFDLGGLTSANSGGSFSTGALEVGTGTSVAAGTYEVCMNAKATPEAAPQSGTDNGISAQFFLYDQAKNPSFTGDLLNISTPLQPDGTNHDSYANGCTLATVPSGGQTWYVYAFGYDSDSGAGNYVVDDVSLSLVAITPAG